MATVASSTNPNIEKIGSIKVYSSSSSNAQERSGLIFGGYAYSADVQANNGDGYSISIRVISKDGTYKISSSDLNATKSGAKNIIIGNFTFYDFYLVSYSIDKEVENSILTLTYKDKSIFMDKVFIGLFTHHYGNVFDTNGKFVQKPGILNSEETIATFKYKCNDTITGIKNAFLIRYLNRVQTIGASQTLLKKYSSRFPTSLPDFISSDAFFCRYNYNLNGTNGGYLVLGREEINEENCALPEVSYCFKDLTSALAFAEIPGVLDFNLGENSEIYRILRRNYFGSLRSVLDQWGNDLGFKFYYQPKIDFIIKDYTSDNSVTEKKTIAEGLKLINLASTSQTLKNLSALFNPSDPKYNKSLQKVVQSLSETATLEGTRKSNVITPIRREARSFNSSYASLSFKEVGVLGLNYLSSFYGNQPFSDETIIGGTLSIYDPELRDFYHLNKGNFQALAISNAINLNSSNYIVSNLDFLLTFASAVNSPSGGGLSPSELLNDYIILLGVYDESKHSLIKDWEKAIMSDYYGKYYMINRNAETSYCDSYTNNSITYETVPPSQSYIGNELPFSNLLYGRFGNDDVSLPSFGSRKYDPIFKAENPFDYRNENNYKVFSETISDYQSSKALTIINLKDNPRAKMALFNCLNSKNYEFFSNFIDINNISLIVCRKYAVSSPITNISISSTANSLNLSAIVVGQGVETTNDSKKTCPKTICEQTLFEVTCGDSSQATEVNQSDTGFTSRYGRTVTITSSTSSCSLILPVSSSYRYAETKNINSTITLAGISYVLGQPPKFEDYNGNVLSHEVIDNTVPEILTQSTTSTGVVDQVITFDENGKNTLVLSAYDYHQRVNRNLNNSVLDPFEQKKISLTSTYIPSQLVDYIFTSPILNSMNFSFDESGFNTVLDFSSRPKQPKQKDSLFLTQRFLRKL